GRGEAGVPPGPRGGLPHGLRQEGRPQGAPDYNRQILRSTDAELLLNIVRLRYNESTLFFTVGGVVAQYSYDASLNAGRTAGGGNPASGTVGTALTSCEKPTVAYTTLAGEEFAPPLLTPL